MAKWTSKIGGKKLRCHWSQCDHSEFSSGRVIFVQSSSQSYKPGWRSQLSHSFLIQNCFVNINQSRLCNGTRLTMKNLTINTIETTIITGKYKGEDVLITRISVIPTRLPFNFKRLQFSVRLAFTMVINKSQGQSLDGSGINLEFLFRAWAIIRCVFTRWKAVIFLYLCTEKNTTDIFLFRKL